MQKTTLDCRSQAGEPMTPDLYEVHTLVVGSGAAGLNAAVQLKANGIEDILIVTEGLDMGTSINTGSDKQTYYKLGMCGGEPDSPESMADALYSGGSMHGDLALVEAALSARSFLHLVDLGVPFPRDPYGQFVGYKTDHDPRQRATSVGPYTSREMCRRLIRVVEHLKIPVHENRQVVSLLTVPYKDSKRAAGAVGLTLEKGTKDWRSALSVYVSENVVFATGGPGGLYRTSVYPKVHTGGIGIALLAGAAAQNLPESQFGLASVKFRWNVSGSYMQVVPRFVSTHRDGVSQEREFLRDYFDESGGMASAVFLKGYQWPFDCRKIIGGSSIIDILVYIETVIKGRRVFLDFRKDPEGFSFDDLSPEAHAYLTKSGCRLPSPIERLDALNPDAVSLYADNGIDIRREPLEIAVCAQHNNGGLAGNLWWESVNIKHLFPVGEVNGSHGVARPGGTALNAGQVGGYRAAEFIGNRYRRWTLPRESVLAAARVSLERLEKWILRAAASLSTWQKEREALQCRMSEAGAHVRSRDRIERAVSDAWKQWSRLETDGCRVTDIDSLRNALITRQLCFSQAVYLEAIRYGVNSGVGSRGSAIVLDATGIQAHPKLDASWRFLPENPSFRRKVLETVPAEDGRVENRWVDRRPLPGTDAWFETAWAAFKRGEIYR